MLHQQTVTRVAGNEKLLPFITSQTRIQYIFVHTHAFHSEAQFHSLADLYSALMQDYIMVAAKCAGKLIYSILIEVYHSICCTLQLAMLTLARYSTAALLPGTCVHSTK